MERICQEALEQPSRQAALRALRDSLGSLTEESLPGLRNEGFLATHELINGVPNRADWPQARDKDRSVLSKTGRNLLESLGFSIEPLDNVTDILKAGDRKNAVGVLLTEHETPESGSERIPGNLSPVSYALARADEQNLDWVVVIHGRKIRLYPVKMGVGVGRKGRTETFLECHTGLLPDDHAAYLWLLFSADALLPDGSLASILTDSRDFAGNLASRLRERIYDEVIPRLAEGLAEARALKNPTAQDLTETYRMAMRVLFRLLFVAYGEDKDLLPYRFNGLYQKRSLKAKARELLELVGSDKGFGEGDAWWQEARAIFHAVDKGNKSWGVPAYNGGLFSSDPEESAIGAALEEVSLPDKVFGPALQYLLLVPTAEGIMGPVDFRSLGVREFGTIYEGLLESELSIAETDLAVETMGTNKGAYRSCKEGEEPIIPRGRIYLHNSSGVRKSTGSYYTKHFAVEHLLDRALEPALDDHFARLDELDELEAAEAFFDFRVADIAMGSGHFLVAAVDRIEARFSGYLSKRAKKDQALFHVSQELDQLRKAATEALGDAADSYPDFEDSALLRRLIARRCIYGVDYNEVAVQLARLSIWIHTFVPGLPLSLLDRNLVHGNSLVGVGRLSELEDKVREEDEGYSLFEANAAEFVGDASDALLRLGRLADATRAEVQEARKAWADADSATAPARALCDILTASRIEDTALPFDFTRWEEEKDSVFDGEDHKHSLSVLRGMYPLHFPVTFPEVFLRERSGFDVILGNPPWDKLRFEAQQFWVARSPGLNALSAEDRSTAIDELRQSRPIDAAIEREEEQRRQRLQTMVNKAFHLQGRGRHGHHDAAKLFTERALSLRSANGRIAYVLPRTALVLGGWADLREAALNNSDLTTLQARNKKGWLFEGIDYRLMIVLLTSSRRAGPPPRGQVLIWPSIADVHQLQQVTESTAIRLNASDLAELTETNVIPWFGSPDDRDVFDPLLSYSRLGSGDAWITGIADSSRWDFSGTGPHSVYVEALETEHSWRVLMTRHVNSFHIAGGTPFRRHVAEPEKLVSLNLGVVLKNGTAALAENHPSIVFRYPTMNDNTRTLIAAVLPESGYLYSKGYAHGLRTPAAGNECDLLALLGYLNTFIADWWCRRFVDRHVTKPVLSNLPLPAWNQHERKTLSRLVSALVARAGVNILPGGRQITVSDDLEAVTEEELMTQIEVMAFRGFGLDAKQWDAVISDFSPNACSDANRGRIHAAIDQDDHVDE